ncbi:MAG: hypothetical protein GY940_18200, partial [bacterium]|nr:hypothetical protein [bacterium]
MLTFCREEKEIDPGNMSYTLLLGRKHRDHRLACVVRDTGQLSEFLEKWLEKGQPPQVYVSALSEGNVREQASLKRYGNRCIKNCRQQQDPVRYLEDLAAIADMYIQGYGLEYHQLFVQGYSRISLPAYPFANESYWVERKAEDFNSTFTEVPMETGTYPGWQFSLPGDNVDDVDNVDNKEPGPQDSNFSIEEKAKLLVQQLVAEQLQKPIAEIETEFSYFDLGLTS